MYALVTGSEGLIGKALVQRLRQEGHTVDGMDKKTGEDINHTLTNRTINYDVVFHLAAETSIRYCIADTQQNKEHNIDATIKTLEFAREHAQLFVYFSSSRVLSKERNPYTAAKTLGEELCKAYHECYGLPYLIIRPSTVYGPGEHSDRIIPQFIRRAIRQEPLHIFGDEHKRLDITHIDDFLNALMLVLDKGEMNDDYNISSGIGVLVQDIATEIIQQTKSKSTIVYDDPEIAQPQIVMVDNNKILALGYEARHDLKTGIKSLL